MFISVVFTQLLPRTPNHFPLSRHWTRDRDFGPAIRDPRPLVKLVVVWMVKNASKWKQLWCHMNHVSFTQAFFASELIYQSTIIEFFSVKAGLLWKLKTHQNGIVDAMCFSMTMKTHTFENTLKWKGPSCLVYYRFLKIFVIFYLVHICVFL